MFSLKKSFACAAWNAHLLIKNIRFYLGLFLGFAICFLLTEKTISLSAKFGTDLQLLEPFIWCYADSDSVLFASLALLLPLSQIPKLDASVSYLVFRAGRLNWIVGQAITVLLVSVIYTFFLLASTCLLSLGNAYIGNNWSDTATVMSFAPEQFDVALNVIRRTVKQTVPYGCALRIFFLMAQYMMLLSLTNLCVSLRSGKKSGMNVVIAISFISYVLTPDRFMVWLDLSEELKYIANLFSAWLSPLQHATYTMHSFGYDSLPTFGQTYFIMGSINLILFICCMLVSKSINFIFQKGEANE